MSDLTPLKDFIASSRVRARRHLPVIDALVSGRLFVAVLTSAVTIPLVLVSCATSGETIETTGSASAPAAALVVNPLQYRDDIVANRLQLEVTNGLPQELAVASVQLLWTGMHFEPTKLDVLITPGRRVDLPVSLGKPTCEIEGTTVGASPSVDDATVLFTLADGTTEVAQVLDPGGTLEALNASGCERTMIEEQISLEFVDFTVEHLDGRDITVARLRLRREAAKGTVQVLSSGNTVPFSLMFGAAHEPPLLTLAAGAVEVDTSVQFLEARCDAHAVAEAKQPFRFVMQLQLGDETPRPYVVEPPPDVHAEMLATAAAGCAVLGEDGSLTGS